MTTASLAAYKNACELLKDSDVLLHASRFDRSAVLSILAEEEFSKAFFLIVCMMQNRWDSVIFHALKRHPEKQSLSDAMKVYFDWFIENYNRVMTRNQFGFVPIRPAQMPGQKWLDDWVGKTKKNVKKARLEHFKQSLLYVNLDKDARVTSEPGRLNRKTAEDVINEARKFKEIVELALGSQIEGFEPIEI